MKRRSGIGFVNTALLPYLRGLKEWPGSAHKQKVISEVMTGVGAHPEWFGRTLKQAFVDGPS